MIQLKCAWFIALKNLRLFMTDRLAVGIFLVFPFLFIVVFNMLMGNLGAEDPRLELHLLTLEADGLSQHIIEELETKDASALEPGDPIVVRETDYALARADVESGKLSGFLAFPAGFTESLSNGSGAALEVVVRADDTNTRMALSGLARGISSRLEARLVAVKSVVALLSRLPEGSRNSPAEVQQLVSQILSDENDAPSLITYRAINMGETKPVNASAYIVPGYLMMFVFFAAAVSAIDIVRERRTHTLERLLAGSVRKESILGGIYLGNVLKGLVQIAIFWAMGILVFRIDVGSAPWAVLLISFLVVLVSAGFSLMLSTIARTDRSASAVAVLASLLLAPLGGCWWPLFVTPYWMQFLAKFTPHGWATTGFNKLLLFGADGAAVLWEMLALAGFAVGFVIVAIINFRTSADAV